MNLYNGFNAVEAGLWELVALFIAVRVPRSTRQQTLGVALGTLGFAAFGITDLLELGRDGAIPLWLWGFKSVCGCVILSARYTWRGWNQFHWHDREFLFGLALLTAVAIIITLQIRIGALPAW